MAAQYRIKEIFYTLQGEGAQAGRPAVFCRFSKCNLWNGRENGRAAAVCNFCDTDFIGTDGHLGGVYDLEQLVTVIQQQWPGSTANGQAQGKPYVVCTGGEPALQLDDELVSALQRAGFEVAIETNGTLPLANGIDWVCLSPKGESELVVIECDELKLVYPQADAPPERFDHIQADHYYLQPMADYEPVVIASDKLQGAVESLSTTNTHKTLQYCLKHPRWKLSLQTHKMIRIE
ncbi:7-carboxy-7-deazaguanine synthase [Bacterioplanes sanyensis]|uniref:7-carboxy-7-deazaguanine synthase n=1 Tax=Bacterioplanes sanyensis TaxID=1249553 RepID=UPI001677FF37|nr:7-carboxy-7-deazaguanine synthase [Bacterioplanes sanyensis]GGY39937.1 7-carboxy-7-deazaguanine synthase [Bacterioplanes sanyensis]